MKSDPTRPYCDDPYCWPGFFNPSPELIRRLGNIAEGSEDSEA